MARRIVARSVLVSTGYDWFGWIKCLLKIHILGLGEWKGISKSIHCVWRHVLNARALWARPEARCSWNAFIIVIFINFEIGLLFSLAHNPLSVENAHASMISVDFRPPPPKYTSCKCNEFDKESLKLFNRMKNETFSIASLVTVKEILIQRSCRGKIAFESMEARCLRSTEDNEKWLKQMRA